MDFSRKIYLALSLILIISLPFLALNLDWGTAWFLPAGILAVAAILALAAFSFRNAILLIILVMPALEHFNYFKINLAAYLPFLNDFTLLVNPASLIYLLIILFGAVTIFEKKSELSGLPLKYLISAASLYAAASIFWSVDPKTSLIDLLYLITPFFLYLVAYSNFSDYGDFLKLLFVSLFSSIIPLNAAAAQLASGSFFYEPDSSLGRLTGGLDHPNTFGLFLFMIASLLISFYLSRGKRGLKDNKSLFTFLAVILFFLILTYSRTSWASLALFILLIIYLERKIILFVLAAIPAAAVIFLIFENIKTRVLEIFDNALFSSVTARLNIWQVALSQIAAKPLFGHGAGTAEAVIENAKPWRGGISLPHNDYLLQALELGFIGLALFLSYTLGAIYYAFNAFRNFADKKTVVNLYGRAFMINFKVLSFGLLAMLIALLPATIFESLSQKIILQIIIWSLLGSLFSLKKVRIA